MVELEVGDQLLPAGKVDRRPAVLAHKLGLTRVVPNGLEAGKKEDAVAALVGPLLCLLGRRT